MALRRLPAFRPQPRRGRTSARVAGIPPTVFSRMSALAASTGAVNLGQGFPDTEGPSTIVEQAVEALRSGHNQYAPGLGTADLRRAIADHQWAQYGITVDPETEVVVTTGATEAIAGALLGLVDPGDEVIALEPFYDSYAAMTAFAGGVLRGVTLRAPDFRLDADALRAAVTKRTKLLLINTPHNPTGTVLDREELEAIARVAVDNDLIVVTDEVYEHLVYSGHEHVPLATLPGMAERTLTLSSVGKSFSLTGWKVGWATGPAELVAAVLGAKQWLSFTSGSPLQPAVAWALAHEQAWPASLARDLEARRDLLCDGLDALGLPARRPEGTYFAVTDISALGWRDGLEFCLALPERAGVVAIPLQGFYADGSRDGEQLVRWAFCKETAVLEEGLRRLGAAELTR
ncbi:pyridoxal phosphate-dependent aminotransferase [Nocardioides jejuensis]|uniref:Putative succinyldiaminopimelate transaminase DapC n=1 Tax=Nocardioides jejuensis TaxID=2502782 RepID=A0A4R1BX78_9ACTN|nr:pyridoxal phosphate-dependent aminotransferase [Nocardioides jejuensis]TCJ21915.1 putative succinyldiaminopimelate transaminase DapC [Nocardioides jejuensis]